MVHSSDKAFSQLTAAWIPSETNDGNELWDAGEDVIRDYIRTLDLPPETTLRLSNVPDHDDETVQISIPMHVLIREPKEWKVFCLSELDKIPLTAVDYELWDVKGNRTALSVQRQRAEEARKNKKLEESRKDVEEWWAQMQREEAERELLKKIELSRDLEQAKGMEEKMKDTLETDETLKTEVQDAINQVGQV